MAQADQYERYMLTLINAERAKIGATALQLELNLNESAQAHSRWMIDVDKFQHAGVDDSTARARMSDAGFDFGTRSIAAENIAAQSERNDGGIMDDVYDLHIALMNSPGHRANILNPDLQYIGIGIETGDLVYPSGREFFSVVATQNFAATNGGADLDRLGTVASDTIVCSAGDDVVRGFRGNDLISGEDGNDTLYGNDGADRLNGGSGGDMLLGGRGHDILNGETGNDVVSGGMGRDLIYGAAGDDTLIGGREEDQLYGGNGADTLKGGAGADVLEGGQGDDDLIGGIGADTFVFMRGSDVDRIKDFSNDLDRIDLSRFNYDSTSQAMGFAQQVGADVVFDFDLGDVLIVENALFGQLADDLVL